MESVSKIKLTVPNLRCTTCSWSVVLVIENGSSSWRWNDLNLIPRHWIPPQVPLPTALSHDATAWTKEHSPALIWEVTRKE